MRILLPTIRDPDQIGGTGTHIAMLTRGLNELGHDAHPLFVGAATPGPIRKAGLIWPAGVLNRARSGWGMMYAARVRGRLLASVTGRELNRAAKIATPFDALNAQEVYSVPYLREVADARGLPLVLTLHGYPLYESLSEGYSTDSRMGRHYLMRAEIRALRLADAVVTVDTRLYRHVLALVPERADSVYTLMNFVDTAAFAPLVNPEEEQRLRAVLREFWDVPGDRTVLFCPRRLVRKNGVTYPSLALAAMTQVDRDRFLLLHAGEGGERGEIERIIEEYGLETNVRLLGGRGPEAIRDLYRLADIVLVPSVHSENVEEATSLSALEAMASNRPLIAGDVGGLAEMIVDEQTGLLVPANAEALAAAILRLAGDPGLGSRLASNARDYVVEHHSYLRAAAAYAAVYERAAEVARSVATGQRASGPVAGKSGLVEAAGGETEPDFVTGGHTGPGPLPDARFVARGAPLWPSISVLGLPLDIVNLEEAAQWAIGVAAGLQYREPGTAIAVSFNPELVMRAQRDPAVAEVLLQADLSYPDGVGAVWAAGRQGACRVSTVSDDAGAHGRTVSRNGAAVRRFAPERVAGVDLAGRILELAAEHDLPVYFLGGAEGVAEEAARLQAERLPGLRLAGMHHGYFSPAEESRVVRAIRESGARILLVALGAPRQELFLHRHREDLGVPVGLGVGGTFDVWARRVRRAPLWARRAKMEWLFRLASDPRRVRRQSALPRYVFHVLRWSPEDYGPPGRKRRLHPTNLIAQTVGRRGGTDDMGTGCRMGGG